MLSQGTIGELDKWGILRSQIMKEQALKQVSQDFFESQFIILRMPF